MLIKERWIYISSKVIKELKKRSWKPNNATRFGFFKFLQQVKKELDIAENINRFISDYFVCVCVCVSHNKS